MPEILTKYPELMVKELSDFGAKCGTKIPKQILKHCPNERFCRLPTGEICIYGLNEISNMKQISPSDISIAIRDQPLFISHYSLIMIFIFFGLGLLAGSYMAGRKR